MVAVPKSITIEFVLNNLKAATEFAILSEPTSFGFFNLTFNGIFTFLFFISVKLIFFLFKILFNTSKLLGTTLDVRAVIGLYFLI